jgi:hypothetical protein
MYQKIISFTLLLLFLTGACGTETDPSSMDFGADYTIVLSDDFPSLNDDELNVEVLYTGCEPNHEFDLNHSETDEYEFEMWLYKLTPNEDCEESFQELRTFSVPDELEQGRLIFIGPNVEQVLREG